MAEAMTKEIGIQKPSDFDGDCKKMQSFVLQCKAYLTINGHICKTDTSRIAFILSFLNEKEAETWWENYYLSIMKNGDLIYPTFKEFVEKFEEGFKPINRSKDAIHKINVLRQGKKTAEEIITEF
jgi:Ty3 transposon capsid-like protein